MISRSRSRIVQAAPLAALLLVGCVQKVNVGGVEYYDFDIQRASKGVRSRAAFETNCPPETLTIIPIGDGPFVKQVGVTACNGMRLIYMRASEAAGGEWMLNSQSYDAPPPH